MITVLSFFISGISLQIKVNIKGQRIARRYAPIKLNCSTDTTPIARAAEIQVNSLSKNYLSIIDGKCFSAYLQRPCHPYICDCSPEGLWFNYNYQVNEPQGFINFTCLMFFGSIGSLSDTIKVHVIGK